VPVALSIITLDGWAYYHMCVTRVVFTGVEYR